MFCSNILIETKHSLSEKIFFPKIQKQPEKSSGCKKAKERISIFWQQKIPISILLPSRLYDLKTAFTVGYGIAPYQQIKNIRSWTITTGRELHPALKNVLFYFQPHYRRNSEKCQGVFTQFLSLSKQYVFWKYPHSLPLLEQCRPH